MSRDATPTRGRETSGLTTRLIVRYVRHNAGEDGVRRLLELAGEERPVAVVEDEREWSSYERKIALLEAATVVLDDPQAPRRIGEWALDSEVGTPVRALLSVLGSPAVVLKSIANAGSKFTSNAIYTARVSRNRATITYRLHEGYEPSRHDCSYTTGLLSQISVLFGLPPARVLHTDCLVAGADACVFEVSWRELPAWWARLVPAGARLRRARLQLNAMADQLSEMQDAVTDLVSIADIDEVLNRIARRARSAVHAYGYVLSVRLPGDSEPRIHTDGVRRERAVELLHALDGGPATTSRGSHISADITSARRSYGRLVATSPSGQSFLPKEAELLEAYAKLAAVALDSALSLTRSRQRERTASGLLRLATDLATTDVRSEVWDIVASAMPDVLGCDRSVIMGTDNGVRQLVVRGAAGWSADLDETVRAFSISWSDTPQYADFVAEPGPRLYRPDDEDPFVAEVCRAFGLSLVAAVPVLDGDRLLGVMLAGWTPQAALPDTGRRLFAALGGLAGQTSSALVRTQLLERARHQATHDPLTGLPNRRMLEDLAGLAHARWRRTNEGYGLLFIDVDGFKPVNDELGHTVGDELLCAIARRLQGEVRGTDVVARYGGDEFVVLVASADDTYDLSTVAHKLGRCFEVPFELGAGPIRISASIGVAAAPDDGETVQELLRCADGRMYEAKQSGRLGAVAPLAGSGGRAPGLRGS